MSKQNRSYSDLTQWTALYNITTQSCWVCCMKIAFPSLKIKWKRVSGTLVPMMYSVPNLHLGNCWLKHCSNCKKNSLCLLKIAEGMSWISIKQEDGCNLIRKYNYLLLWKASLLPPRYRASLTIAAHQSQNAFESEQAPISYVVENLHFKDSCHLTVSTPDPICTGLCLP